MAEHLDAFVRGETQVGAAAGAGRLVWVFTGQGAEACQLPPDFLDAEPAFREALAACDQALTPHLGWSVVAYLLGQRPDLNWRDTRIAQPVIFAVQVALAAVWRSWGLVPEAVVGHSLGEIAAAHVAGILSLADAAWLVAERGRLMQQAHGQGRAASVQATPAEAEAVARRYPGRVFVGASNSPVAAILSGEGAALDEIMAEWNALGRFFRYLPVDYAFHSDMMRPLGDELARLAAQLQPQPAQVPLVSTVTGSFCAGPEMDAAYWGRNLSAPVRFAEAMHTLLAAGHDVFLELGPHPLLQRPMQQCVAAWSAESPGALINPALVASLRQGQAPGLTLRQGLGTLYTAGLQPDWARFFGSRQRPVELPPYAWQHQQFWVEPPASSPAPRAPALEPGQHPFLGRRQHSPLGSAIVFEAPLDPEAWPLLLDHHLHGVAVLPAVVMLDMALSAAVRAWSVALPLALENVLIQSPLIIEPGVDRLAQLILQPDGPSRARFHVYSGVVVNADEVTWTEHAQGVICWDLAGEIEPSVDLPALRASLPAEVAPAELYAGFRARGLVHGAAYQHLVGLHVGPQAALGWIESQPWPPSAAGDGPCQLPPPLFESCLQVVAAPLFNAAAPEGAQLLYVPLALDRLVFYRRPALTVWSHARLTSALPAATDAEPPETYRADVDLVADDGHPVARLEGLRLKRAAPEALRRLAVKTSEAVDDLYQLDWQLIEPAPAASSRLDTGVWLLFADSAGLASALAARRTAQGQRCLLVLPAVHYSHPAPDTFCVNPLRPEDFTHLWHEALGAPGLACSAVLYLWPAAPDAVSGGLSGALHVAQMVARHATAETRLWFVTPTADAAPEPAPVADGLWGLAATFALEYGAHWGGFVQVEAALPFASVAEAVHQAVLAGDEDLLALRADGRFAARLRPLSLPASASLARPVRPDGTYLVTGGLGALGQELVRWLAGQGARHVAVISRRPFASPEVEALRRSLPDGVVLSSFQADVSDRAALAAALAALATAGPPLAGVFHLAGALDDGVLLQQSPERFARVWAPKAEAAWHLHALTAHLPLDYFVLFASVAGVLGAAGQSNYAAANAALDGLARFRQRQGLPALSVDWSIWGSVGMAARLQVAEQARLAAYGLRPITPEHGLALLGRLLAHPGPQAVVLPVDWQRFSQALPGWRGRSLLRALLPAPTPGERDDASAQVVRARLLALPSAERPAALQTLLAEQVRRVLGLAAGHALDPKRGFFQLGMDSLMAVELQQRLQRQLAVTLPATAVFDYPSLETMAAYLNGLLQPAAPQPHDADSAAADEALAAVVAEVKELSDDELDALLANSKPD